MSLREAVLAFSRGDFDVRVGRQQIVWGEAIGTFVTDVVNPRDFREFILPEFTELRIPIWALDVTYRLAPNVTLEGVWTPDTMSNRLAKQGAEYQFAPPAYRFPQPGGAPARRPGRVQPGPQRGRRPPLGPARGLGRVADLLRPGRQEPGHLPEPRAAIRPARRHRARAHATRGCTSWAPRWPRASEPVVVRAEAALTIGKRYATTDPLDLDGVVRRDTIDWLVGVDYTFFGLIDTALQVSQKILTGSATNLTQPGVEGQATTSVALRVATGFFDNTLNPTVLVRRRTPTAATCGVSPRLDWLVTGSVTVSVGFDIFEGHQQTLYGQFDHTDRVTFTTTWRF